MKHHHTILKNFRTCGLGAKISLLLIGCLGILSGTAIGKDANTRGIPEEYRQGMHVILTGVGSRMQVNSEGGSSVAVVIDGRVLQFDMGLRVVERLVQAGINPKRIDYVFFSHMHMDHIADFPGYASISYMFGGKLRIFGPPGTAGMVDGAHRFLAKDLEAVQSYLGKLDHTVEEIQKNGVVLKTKNFTVTAAQTPHFSEKSPNSFAYRVDSQYGSVVISGDTAASLNVVDLAKGADLLVHEAWTHEPWMYGDKPPFKESQIDKLEDGLREGPPKMGHPTPTEVGKVAEAAGVKKLVIYHYPPFTGTAAGKKIARDVWGMAPVQYDAAFKSEFIVAIRKHYTGLVMMGEPLMTFSY